jgi:uncharacterized protein
VRTLTVDDSTARRFVLGGQGLWPGRRWKGREGLREALRHVGSIQVDPLNVVGHSQDLVALSRVDGYRPQHLERALYRDRSLFEWGGNLQIRPTEAFPYLLPKIRSADYLGRRAAFERTHATLVARILRAVETRGPIGSRDLAGGEGVSSYRARRDTGLALYYLWLRGDLMIHSRDAGDRKYDLTTRLLPARLLEPASAAESERYLFRRGTMLYGLPNASELLAVQRSSAVQPLPARDLRQWIERAEKAGRLVRVSVRGWRGPSWVDAEDLPTLEVLREGRTPATWAPVSTSNEEEVTFLAPLDIVSARGRARRIFGFDYLWEVYKPPTKRRWAYYVLPILSGDRLVGRMEPSVDPATGNLVLRQIWWEANVDPATLAEPVARGLRRLVAYLGAPGLTLAKLSPRSFRTLLARATRARS